MITESYLYLWPYSGKREREREGGRRDAGYSSTERAPRRFVGEEKKGKIIFSIIACIDSDFDDIIFR